MHVSGRLALAVIAIPAASILYKDGPPAAHTGSFGEPSCHTCHFDGPLDSDDATAALLHAPTEYVADSTYRLTVTVSRDGLGAGGFSLSGRFPDGGQAGAFQSIDELVVVNDDSSEVEYVMHTLTGSRVNASDTLAWSFLWRAPSSLDTVVFSLAGNAANGDDSPFGDLIRLTSTKIPSEE